MRILGLICKGVLDMERYQITLHSPMGPRRGGLEIVNDREAVVELLGFRSGVAVRRMDGGRFCLTGDLDSIMGKIRFEAKLTIRDGAAVVTTEWETVAEDVRRCGDGVEVTVTADEPSVLTVLADGQSREMPVPAGKTTVRTALS